MTDRPEPRIGTAEREAALAELNEHFSLGRLSMPEFEERTGQIMDARTRSDLDTVFHDLPRASAGNTPARAVPGAVAEREPGQWKATVMALTPFVALALFFLVDINNSWLFFLLIPVMGILLYGSDGSEKKKKKKE